MPDLLCHSRYYIASTMPTTVVMPMAVVMPINVVVPMAEVHRGPLDWVPPRDLGEEVGQVLDVVVAVVRECGRWGSVPKPRGLHTQRWYAMMQGWGGGPGQGNGKGCFTWARMCRVVMRGQYGPQSARGVTLYSARGLSRSSPYLQGERSHLQASKEARTLHRGCI